MTEPRSLVAPPPALPGDQPSSSVPGAPRVALVLVSAGLALAAVAARHVSRSAPGPVTVAVDLGRYQEVRHVAPARGSARNADGSRARPWPSIAQALAAIADAGPAKRYAILVAEGSYGGETLEMAPHVDLYGGFDAGSWRRDIFAHPSILDGETRRRVVVGADHSVLDGFVVRGGSHRGHGAGVACLGVSPRVTNNTFLDNRVLAPANWHPVKMHEDAEDGAAVAVVGGTPEIAGNLFARNSTEVGRGGAIGCRGGAPRIARNVFIDNVSGTADPMRSSDGGAVSAYDRSRARIEENLFVGNRAAGRNDGGAIFVALWSPAVIARNVLAGNESTDDAGAIFVGGQKHHYGTPLDPMPPKEEFFVRVEDNVIVGNRNPSGTSGGLRMTMESRGIVAGNVLAANAGGLYVQRSDVDVVNNTVLDPSRYVDESKLARRTEFRPPRLRNNIFRIGLVLDVPGATLTHCLLPEPRAGHGNLTADPRFTDDGRTLGVTRATFDPRRYQTTLQVALGDLAPEALRLRVARAGERWTVVHAAAAGRVVVWGDASAATSLEVVPSYRLAAGSPCIDAGTDEGAPARDRDGDPRPLRGRTAPRVDIGADEYAPITGR
jgi:hypothetical protein